MVVSIAMFGMAVAGTFLALRRVKDPLYYSSILFPLCTIGGFFVLNNISFDPIQAMVQPLELLKLLPYYVILGSPLFLFGMVIVHCFFHYSSQAGKIYFFNLFGSALGALLIFPLMAYFGLKSIFIIALLPFIVCFWYPRKRIVSFLAGTIFVSFLFFPFEINFSPYKELKQALQYPNSQTLSTHYDAYSRIDVVKSSFTRYAPGLSLRYDTVLPPQLGVLVDGSAMNAITQLKDSEFLNYLPTSIGYYLLHQRRASQGLRVAVLNAGAGLDVLTALQHKADVTAVESNPLIVNLLKNQYRDFSGTIYHKARVVIDQGRSFIKKSGAFDIIILSLSGNILSDASGVYGLNENYLLTVEAFWDYYRNLSKDGFLVITRYLSFPAKETLRLFSLGLEINPQADKLLLFRSPNTITFVLGKVPFSPDTLEDIKAFTGQNKFDIVYAPKDFTPNLYGRFQKDYYYEWTQAMLKDKATFYKDYIYNVRPVYDDKPFYFNFFQWKTLSQLQKYADQRQFLFLEPGFLLLFLLAQALALALVLIVGPLFFHTRRMVRKLPLIYFFCLGMAYFFIEIFFIQKMVFFFGQVIIASSAVIFGLLLFSGLGALYADRLHIKKLPLVILAIFLMTTLYSLFLPRFLENFLVYSHMMKIIFLYVFIAPLGFFMGMPFPMGIKALYQDIIPWAWAINGIASVLSTILAIFLALSFGYLFILSLSGAIYLLSLLFIYPSLVQRT